MVVVSPATLAFNAVGAVAALPVTVSQAQNTGGFTISPCTAGSTTVASAPATTTGAFSVTPQNAGLCRFTITGSGAQTATISVTVTTTILNQQ